MCSIDFLCKFRSNSFVLCCCVWSWLYIDGNLSKWERHCDISVTVMAHIFSCHLRIPEELQFTYWVCSLLFYYTTKSHYLCMHWVFCLHCSLLTKDGFPFGWFLIFTFSMADSMERNEMEWNSMVQLISWKVHVFFVYTNLPTVMFPIWCHIRQCPIWNAVIW